MYKKILKTMIILQALGVFFLLNNNLACSSASQANDLIALTIYGDNPENKLAKIQEDFNQLTLLNNQQKLVIEEQKKKIAHIQSFSEFEINEALKREKELIDLNKKLKGELKSNEEYLKKTEMIALEFDKNLAVTEKSNRHLQKLYEELSDQVNQKEEKSERKLYALKNELDEIKKRFASKTNECEALNQANKELRALIEQNETGVATREALLKREFEHQTTIYSAEVSRYQKENTLLNQNLESLHLQFLSKEKELETAQKLLSKNIPVESFACAKINELQREISLLQEEYEQSRRSLFETLQQARKEYQAIKSEIFEKEHLIRIHQAQLQQAHEQNHHHTEIIATLSTQLKKARSEQQELLSSNHLQLTSEISKLQQYLNTTELKAELAQSKLARQMEAFNTLYEQFEKNNRILQDAMLQAKTLENEKLALTQKLTSEYTNKEEVLTKLYQVNNNLSTYESKLSEAQTDQKTLLKELHDTSQHLVSLHREFDITNAPGTSPKNLIEGLQARLAENVKIIKRLEDESNARKEESSQLYAAALILKKEHGALKEKFHTANHENKTLQMACNQTEKLVAEKETLLGQANLKICSLEIERNQLHENVMQKENELLSVKSTNEKDLLAVKEQINFLTKTLDLDQGDDQTTNLSKLYLQKELGKLKFEEIYGQRFLPHEALANVLKKNTKALQYLIDDLGKQRLAHFETGEKAKPETKLDDLKKIVAHYHAIDLCSTIHKGILVAKKCNVDQSIVRTMLNQYAKAIEKSIGKDKTTELAWTKYFSTDISPSIQTLFQEGKKIAASLIDQQIKEKIEKKTTKFLLAKNDHHDIGLKILDLEETYRAIKRSKGAARTTKLAQCKQEISTLNSKLQSLKIAQREQKINALTEEIETAPHIFERLLAKTNDSHCEKSDCLVKRG